MSKRPVRKCSTGQRDKRPNRFPNERAKLRYQLLYGCRETAMQKLSQLSSANALRGINGICQIVADYIDYGWVCLPVEDGLKRPMISWKTFQTERPTTAQYLDWFAWDHFDAPTGIAIVLGPVSNLFVVDIDGREAHRELVRRLGRLPHTPYCHSGSGDPHRGHLYFRHPKLGTNAKATPWHPQLEFRGEGGLVVAPPSIHATGSCYTWKHGFSPRDLAPADLPKAMLKSLVMKNKRRAAKPAVRQERSKLVSHAQYMDLAMETQDFLTGHYADGPSWNDRLFKAACDMCGCGHQYEAAKKVLLAGAQPWNEWESEAAIRTIKSAFSEDRTPTRTGFHSTSITLLPTRISDDRETNIEKKRKPKPAAENPASKPSNVENISSLEIRITSATHRRSSTDAVTALLGGEVIHADIFSVASANKRKQFVSELRKILRRRKMEVSFKELDKALLDEVGRAVHGGLSALSDPQQVLSRLGLEIIAEDDKGQIVIQSNITKKLTTICKASSLRYEDAVQLTGDTGLISRNLAESGDQSATLAQLKEALALGASKAPRLSSLKRCGQGIWESGRGLRDAQLVVDGSDVYRLLNGQLDIIHDTVIGSTLIDRDTAKQWHGSLLASVAEMNHNKTKQIMHRLVALLRKWNWKNELSYNEILWMS